MSVFAEGEAFADFAAPAVDEQCNAILFRFFCASGDRLILRQVLRARFVFPFNFDDPTVLTGWNNVDIVRVHGGFLQLPVNDLILALACLKAPAATVRYRTVSTGHARRGSGEWGGRLPTGELAGRRGTVGAALSPPVELREKAGLAFLEEQLIWHVIDAVDHQDGIMLGRRLHARCDSFIGSEQSTAMQCK